MMMVLMILMLRCPHHELLLAPVFCPAVSISAADDPSVSQSVFTITEKTPTYYYKDIMIKDGWVGYHSVL